MKSQAKVASGAALPSNDDIIADEKHEPDEEDFQNDEKFL
jgi:hypothetical protein